MTVTVQIKILDRKIMQNQAQYDLDRKAAEVSALSSNNLDKYESLTGEDLSLKSNTIEQARFEYSPLGKILNKGLSEMRKTKNWSKDYKILKARLKAKIKKNQNQLKMKNSQKYLKMNQLWLIKSLKQLCC